MYAPKPQIKDLNGDGAPDILAGVATIMDYFANTGDSVNPCFDLEQEQYQGIGQSSINPCLVDIDADGDLDLLCGTGAIPGPPSIPLYLNEGSPRNPIFQLYSQTYVTNPDFSVYLYPRVTDIDADGDFDLFVFDSDGHFYYYQNNGTPQWPNFTLITNQWQGIHQFPNLQWYGFVFGDMDHDGDLDLLIGSPEHDNLYFYRNQGTPQYPQMVLESTNFLEDDYPYIYTPELVDIDNDQDLDLFIGHTNGGMLFFRNVTDTTAVPLPGTAHARPCKTTLSIGTNPANPVTAISYKLQAASVVNLSVYDIAGRKVATLVSGKLSAGEHNITWDASGNASGVYLVRLETSGSGATPTMLTKKVVVVK